MNISPRAAAVLGIAAAALFFPLVIATSPDQKRSDPPAVGAAPPPEPGTVVTVELSPSPVSGDTPTLIQRAEANIDGRIRALAEEMTRMWTRDPEKLVEVIDSASRSASASQPVTLLLAIAQAETNGKILEVSEAAAVGLAQATPLAYLQENLTGPLYLTNDYFVGVRAYLTKKPLGDADTIASLLVKKSDPATRKRATRLAVKAIQLRGEGFEELELLRPHAPRAFFRRIEAADAHNLRRLRELQRLTEHGTAAEIKSYRDEVRREYRALKSLQTDSWKAYRNELVSRRDSMLREHYGLDAAIVIETMAYQASEYLGANLDDRFSATGMARFLVIHLERKAAEARLLAKNEDVIEELTAALYNGGAHNVKRMLAGLILSLPETDRYKRRVPATRRRLDARLATLEERRENNHLESTVEPGR